jgi:hypothetical protein
MFLINLIDSLTNIFAHLSLGKPNIPELIAGIDILLNPFVSARFKAFFIADLNF